MIDLIQPSPTITFGSSTSYTSTTTASTNVNVEGGSESSNDTTTLFECPVESCICSYVKYGNLLRHLAVGDHRKKREKRTSLDVAKILYHQKLASVENQRIISLSLDHITIDSTDFDQLPKLKTGWGLPKQHASVRFSIRQKEFLDVSVPYS